MADYSEDIAGTLEMIREEGQLVSWYKPSETDDATKPWLESEELPGETIPDVPMVFVPINRVDFETHGEIKGTEIPINRQQGLLPGACGFVPNVKDIVIRGNRRYSVINFDEINPAGDPILYILQLHEE